MPGAPHPVAKKKCEYHRGHVMLSVSTRTLLNNPRLMPLESITMAVNNSKLYPNGAPHGVRSGEKNYNNWPNDAGVRSPLKGLDVPAC